jgi:CRP-like cAMP-binding protein
MLAQVTAAYPTIAEDLAQPLLNFVTVAREALGGDAEKILLILIVGVRTSQHPEFADVTPSGLRRGETPVLPSLGINIRSIADSTGIPRETVRRKVAELVKAGWLARDGNDVRYTAEGYLAVTPAREAILAMAVRNYETVSRLLNRREPA